MKIHSFFQVQSGLGTAAVTVFDKSVDPIACIRRLAHFYKHESCGQCTPCREGTGWLEQILESMEVGDADEREWLKTIFLWFFFWVFFWVFFCHFFVVVQ